MCDCKKIANLLIIAMLAGMTSCGGDAPAADTTAGGETTTAAPVEEGPKLEVPESDFGGHTVTFLAVDKYTSHFKLIAEEENGDTLNDAGYKRARAVGDLLNVEFDKEETPQNDVSATLIASVMAGEGAYDFVLPHANIGTAAMVTSGVLLDWKELEYANFSNPWWNTEMQDAISIAGKMFWASGDITITWQSFGALLFNKSYLTDYNIKDNPYDLVWDGKWTLDKMKTMISGISADLNGDSVMDAEDQYGLLTLKSGGVRYQSAAGQPMTIKDADGCPVLDMGTDRMAAIVQKYYDIVMSPDTFLDQYSSTSYADSTYRSMLEGGRSFLTFFDPGGMYTHMREISYDFGILPLPKFDEAQKTYDTIIAAGIIGVPADVTDPERTGIIAEALAYYSYEHVRPAFFDVVLQNKAVQDEDSYRVLTLMQDSKCFDIAYNFVGSPNAYSILDKVVITNGGTDFASYYDSVKDAINKGFRDIYDAVKAQ